MVIQLCLHFLNLKTNIIDYILKVIPTYIIILSLTYFIISQSIKYAYNTLIIYEKGICIFI